MPRGKRVIPVYTGKAAEIYKKVQELETELKEAKDELKAAYKVQLKEEKVAAKAAAKAKEKEDISAIMKAMKESGKSADDILAMLRGEPASSEE